MKVKVGVIGYGTIGKRVIDAIELQNDMEFVGVVVRSPNTSSFVASYNQKPLYLTDSFKLSQFDNVGIKVQGFLNDLLQKVDIVIDCTQRGNAKKNLHLYQKYNLPVIVHGGEDSDIGLTFNSFVNYESIQNEKVIRIGSCNTTGIVRSLYLLDKFFSVHSVFVCLVRCATDPNKAQKGIVNGLSIAKGMSHHAEDIKLLLPHINIYSQAVAAPMTHGHIGMIKLSLEKKTTVEEVISLFEKSPRIKVVSSEVSTTTAQLAGQFIYRPRSDKEELIILKDSINVIEKELYFIMSIHMESIVIPETIDCIRSVFNPSISKVNSIYQTDISLNLQKNLSYYERLLS